MIKNHIVERINKIKSEEELFNSSWWNNNFVSYSFQNGLKTEHISKIEFEELNDEDLVRLFEYVLLCRADIVSNRVKQMYGI